MKTGTFFRNLFLSMTALWMSFPAQGQAVPGAIKYQAVLRDVNGKPMGNKSDVNLILTLRLDDPAASGTIAYQEEHRGISTNPYGVIHLEIGRGTVLSGTTLNDVPWAEHEIYLQMEIETDGTGYTYMGNVELLTVPYAFYAGNASGDRLYHDLDDGVLPKYAAAEKALVNSGVSEKGRVLTLDADTIKFRNGRESGNIAYKFPVKAGRRGQVLRLADNDGTLVWDTAGGGGGGASLNLTGDGNLVYWNDRKGELDTTPFVYDYRDGRRFSLNGEVSGDNNLLTADGLGDAQIWVGDGNKSRLSPVNMHGHVMMDKTGKTELGLVMKDGIRLIRGQGGSKDTLQVDAVTGAQGGSDSLWRRNAAENLYAYNRGKDLDKTFVGIGTDVPAAMLHVQGGDVRFSAPADADGKTPLFSWNARTSSLFAGALTTGTPNLGNYSIALGRDASVTADHGMAFGDNSSVSAANAFAMGSNSNVSGNNSMALGQSSEAAGMKSVAIGDNAKALGDNSVVLGHSQMADRDAVLIGYGNSRNTPASGAVLIGHNIQGLSDGALSIGFDNQIGQNSISIGTRIESGGNSLIIGDNDGSNGFGGGIIYGSTALGSGSKSSNLVSVGGNNSYDAAGMADESYANLFGSILGNNGEYMSLTMVGDGYTSSEAFMSLTGDSWQNPNTGQWEDEGPVFMYGSQRVFTTRALDPNTTSSSVAFEISNMGNAFFAYDIRVRKDIFADGQLLTPSDRRLKDSIVPLSFSPVLLDLIEPVSFVYKADKTRKTCFGFIAQDVRKVFSGLVKENAKGMLSVDYIGFVPVLWQINRQLAGKVDDLEKRLEQQQRKQAELEGELRAIKEKLGM